MFQSEENDSVESQDNGVVLVPAPAPTKPAWGKPATATPTKVNSGLPTEQTKSKSTVVAEVSASFPVLQLWQPPPTVRDSGPGRLYSL